MMRTVERKLRPTAAGQIRRLHALLQLRAPSPSDRTLTVTHCGRICIGKRKISLSHVFAGRALRIREVEDNIWLVSFMHYDLGFFDHETGRVECADNPFGVKLLPMSSE